MEAEEDLRKSYMEKLKIDGKTIPDPLKIPIGWAGEDEGVYFRPMLTYPDILTYLLFFPLRAWK